MEALFLFEQLANGNWQFAFASLSSVFSMSLEAFGKALWHWL